MAIPLHAGAIPLHPGAIQPNACPAEAEGIEREQDTHALYKAALLQSMLEPLSVEACDQLVRQVKGNVEKSFQNLHPHDKELAMSGDSQVYNPDPASRMRVPHM